MAVCKGGTVPWPSTGTHSNLSTKHEKMSILPELVELLKDDLPCFGGMMANERFKGGKEESERFVLGSEPAVTFALLLCG